MKNSTSKELLKITNLIKNIYFVIIITTNGDLYKKYIALIYYHLKLDCYVLTKDMGVIKTNINDEIMLREKIIKLAILQHNKLYEHGKNGPDTFDCAGLVWYIYNEICKLNLYYNGIGLSTTTKIMTNTYGKIILYKEDSIDKDLSIIRKGDIIFFHRQSMNDNEPKENNKYPGHCGIYLGNNSFIHSSKPKGMVIISNFDKNAYWKRVLVASKDIISDNKVYEKLK